MKVTTTLLSLLALTASCFADPASDEVKAAATKVAESSGYKWTATTETPAREGGENRWRPGPTNGATQKDGYTTVSMSRGDSTTEIAFKGTTGVLKTPEGWKTAAQLAASAPPAGEGGDRRGGGRGRMSGRMLESFKLPASAACELAAKIEGMKKEGDVISGDLTGDVLKEQFSFGRGPRGGGGEAPPLPEGAKGSVKFWVKDGNLTKYEVRVEGTLKFNEREMKLDRTTTTEFKDCGATKVEPEAAAKVVLDAAPPATAPAPKAA